VLLRLARGALSGAPLSDFGLFRLAFGLLTGLEFALGWRPAPPCQPHGPSVRVARRTSRRCSLPHAALFPHRWRLPPASCGLPLPACVAGRNSPGADAVRGFWPAARRSISSFRFPPFPQQLSPPRLWPLPIGLLRLPQFFRDLLRSIKVDNAVIDRRCGGFSRGRAVPAFPPSVRSLIVSLMKKAAPRDGRGLPSAECAGLVTGRSRALRLSHLLHRQIVLLAGAMRLNAHDRHVGAVAVHRVRVVAGMVDVAARHVVVVPLDRRAGCPCGSGPIGLGGLRLVSRPSVGIRNGLLGVSLALAALACASSTLA
jgi:hypothetical protein